MTEDQKNLVRNSWKIIRDIDAMLVGDVFYSKLFADHPELRPMFPENMTAQYKKLVDMLSIIVARVDKLDELATEISEMAHRHAGYGVRPLHYKWVGNALIWTLQQGFGKDWTEEMHAAWSSCYTELSEMMMAVYAR